MAGYVIGALSEFFGVRGSKKRKKEAETPTSQADDALEIFADENATKENGTPSRKKAKMVVNGSPIEAKPAKKKSLPKTPEERYEARANGGVHAEPLPESVEANGAKPKKLKKKKKKKVEKKMPTADVVVKVTKDAIVEPDADADERTVFVGNLPVSFTKEVCTVKWYFTSQVMLFCEETRRALQRLRHGQVGTHP